MTNLEKVLQVNKEFFAEDISARDCINPKTHVIDNHNILCDKCFFEGNCKERIKRWLEEEVQE